MLNFGATNHRDEAFYLKTFLTKEDQTLARCVCRDFKNLFVDYTNFADQVRYHVAWGNQQVLEFLYELNSTAAVWISCRLQDLAARFGNLAILHWLCGIQKGVSISYSLVNNAAAGGQLEILEWLVSKGGYIHVDAQAYAIGNGHFEVVAYLRSLPKQNEWSGFMIQSIVFGPLHLDYDIRPCPRKSIRPLESLKWLASQQLLPQLSTDETSFLGSTDIETLSWAKERGYPFDWGVGRSAAIDNNINMLEWIRDNLNIDWDPRISANAAHKGNKTVLEWLYKYDKTLLNEGTISNAAYGGHTELLQWLWSLDLPWYAQTSSLEPTPCESAAMGQHLETLQWLYSHGWPLSAKTLWWAMGGFAREYNIEMVKWLEEHNCPKA